ncbi:hypothetical protein [Vitiosangium sp. GDMCC 1.1324]|uniref:hypothetical protein n=1 Tax=Vitiosangium sp. (strain GDMCC 1.1324) TaxID=2138576 RepID=UPI000D33F023|nr:hypothetical protein [Vitiosangium sp. GDMCC 1.1324]PTL75580.1 hypothetical protein DAT35_54175 [Vitiosangium sp. GDMCC 1.1324]
MKSTPLVRAALTVLVSTSAMAGDFYGMTPTTCHTNVAPLFTTGGQYLDPNNGVRQDAWSMLMRWQGNIASTPVSYNVGTFTGLSVPTPFSSWQRGQQPESASGTPAAQVYCYDAGMILNTWSSPRTHVEGGGYNDMYGYAWSSANRPRPFSLVTTRNGVLGTWPSELVLQGSMAVPLVTGWNTSNGGATWNGISNPGPGDLLNSGAAQLSMFAYLRDTSHPNLRPIAVLAGAYANNGSTTCPTNGRGNVSFDYPTGAWYSGNAICTTDVSTVRYTGATMSISQFSDLRFFRMHYTRQNLINFVNRINNMQCASDASGNLIPNSCNCSVPGTNCPPIGYSTNPDHYVIEYTGVLGEIIQCNTTGCDTVITDRQISMAARVYGYGSFWYVD